MFKKVGYSLIDKNNNEIEFWGFNINQEVSIPNPLSLPNGDQIHAPSLGSYGNFCLVERWIDGDPLKKDFVSEETKIFDGEKIIVTWKYRDPTEKEYAEAIQKHIDSIAKSRQYNDSISLSSYTNSTNTQWKQEAEIFVAWRDSVWTTTFQKLNEITQAINDAITQHDAQLEAAMQNGENIDANNFPLILPSKPTIEEIIAELPVITWP